MNPADLLLCGGLRAMLPRTKEEWDRIKGFNDFADKLAAWAVQQPCWHLSPICVVPASQGRGAGKALMDHALSRVRASGQPCYLETQSAGNAAFYRACGFRKISHTPVPGTDMVHWGMLWEP